MKPLAIAIICLAIAAPARAQDARTINAAADRLLISPETLAVWHLVTFEAIAKADREMEELTAKRLRNEQEAVLKAMAGKSIAWRTTVRDILITGTVAPVAKWETKEMRRGLPGTVTCEIAYDPNKMLSGDGVSVGQVVDMAGMIERVEAKDGTLKLKLVDVAVSLPPGKAKGKKK